VPRPRGSPCCLGQLVRSWLDSALSDNPQHDRDTTQSGTATAGPLARGWGSPPYHPLCCGQLVPIGPVEAMVPVPELVVEQEVAPPPQI
jgi:hypothetical protein